ncbi:MAG: rhombosortase [Magnetococcales bacterium]|nr:rhombosortase [Magnetococcales bacterium]
MNTARPEPNLPWLTSLIVLLCSGLYFLFGPANAQLVYDRERITQGDFYTLISGHFIHSDPSHLFWNLAGLLIIGSLLEQKHHFSAWQYMGLLLAAILTIDLYLWLQEPSLIRYCGLSGLLNAQLALLLGLSWKQERHWTLVVITLAILLKIGLEWHLKTALLTQTSWVTTPSAHGVGLLTGGVFFLLSDKKTAAGSTIFVPILAAKD